MTDFRPVREFGEWPVLEAQPFDTRSSTFIPDLSVDNSKIRNVSPTKLDLIGAKVYRTTTQSIDDATPTAISFDAEEFDAGDLWVSSAATKLTVPYEGIYSIVGYAEFAASATLTQARVYIYSNGAAIVKQKFLPIGAAVTTEMPIPYVGRFSAGDYLELYVRQTDSGSAALDTVAGVTGNFLSAVFLGSTSIPVWRARAKNWGGCARRTAVKVLIMKQPPRM